jgi:hypothetical protein
MNPTTLPIADQKDALLFEENNYIRILDPQFCNMAHRVISAASSNQKGK